MNNELSKIENYEHEHFFAGAQEQTIKIMMLKNRREKVMANALASYDVPSYLPVYQKIKRYKKGTSTHYLPL
ncbi:MAG: hypothetical protein HQL32_13205, partial [Planctomycetes bacterium]|nr:hypothetical protein [Planctomycetota bacterium]